ncbi:MAG TPA: FecR family protein [Candidatus Polarisedimenticolia bacterium]|nr:FecR family protein [Candidatus Polarisedimenticolia bacterium]
MRTQLGRNSWTGRAAVAVLALAAGLLAAPGTIGAPAGAAVPDPIWSAVAASGRVEAGQGATCDTKWSRVVRGDAVPALSRVRTHERSRATLTRGGDVVLVSARSEVVLPDRQGSPVTLIEQNQGRALYQFETREKGQVEVVTPYLVAGVKGTVFSVDVGAEHASVSVVSGHVQVRSLLTGEMADLFAGDLALVDARESSMTILRDRTSRAGMHDDGIPEKVRVAHVKTAELLRTASGEDLDWESEDTDLWDDLSDSRLLEDSKDLTRDTTTDLLKEDQVLTKAEEDLRKVTCLLLKCR